MIFDRVQLFSLAKPLVVVALLMLAACMETSSSSVTGAAFGRSWLLSTSSDEITGTPNTSAIIGLSGQDFSEEPDAIGVWCEDGSDLYFSVLSEGFWGGQYHASNRKIWLRIGDSIYETRYLQDVEGDAAWLIHAQDPHYTAGKANEILRALVENTGSPIVVRVMDWQGAVHTSSTAGNVADTSGLSQVLNSCGR